MSFLSDGSHMSILKQVSKRFSGACRCQSVKEATQREINNAQSLPSSSWSSLKAAPTGYFTHTLTYQLVAIVEWGEGGEPERLRLHPRERLDWKMYKTIILLGWRPITLNYSAHSPQHVTA